MTPVDDKVRALVAKTGASAARLGVPVADCPYPPQGTPSQREAARVWVAAYLATKPPLDVSYDDEGGHA